MIEDLIYTSCVGDSSTHLEMLGSMLARLPIDTHKYCYVSGQAAAAKAELHGATVVLVEEPESYDATMALKWDAIERGIPLPNARRCHWIDCDVLWARSFSRWSRLVPDDFPLVVEENHPVVGNCMSSWGWEQKADEVASGDNVRSACAGLVSFPGRKSSCFLRAWRDAASRLPPGLGREQSALNWMRWVERRAMTAAPWTAMAQLSERHRWDPRKNRQRLGKTLAFHASGLCETKSDLLSIWRAGVSLLERGMIEELEGLW